MSEKRETLKYGGYLTYPLAPKDIKLIHDLEKHIVTPEDVLNAVVDLARQGFGLRFEPNEDQNGFKIVAYNLYRVTPDDDHVYYVSGESTSLHKAVCVIVHKLNQLKREDFSKFVSSPLRGEYR